MSTVQVGMSSVQVAMSTVQVAMSTVQVGMSTGKVGTASWKVAMSTVTVVTVQFKKVIPDLSKHLIEIGGLALRNPNPIVIIRSTPSCFVTTTI